jgi:hypothetical protein
VISIADSPVTITAVPTLFSETNVFEAGLPARGNEPPGSDSASNSETVTGTVTFTAADGVASVTINGVTVTGAGQQINTPQGVLTITAYNPRPAR